MWTQWHIDNCPRVTLLTASASWGLSGTSTTACGGSAIRVRVLPVEWRVSLPWTVGRLGDHWQHLCGSVAISVRRRLQAKRGSRVNVGVLRSHSRRWATSMESGAEPRAPRRRHRAASSAAPGSGSSADDQSVMRRRFHNRFA